MKHLVGSTSSWFYIVPEKFDSSNEAVEIGGKSVTFIGGEVSGQATWTFHGYKVDPAYGFGPGGSSPGVGRMEIYNSSGYLLAHLALPLSSTFTVQNVDKIKVYAEAFIPDLSIPPGHRCIERETQIEAHVVASVYYKVESDG